jgi:transposase InsO family protein
MRTDVESFVKNCQECRRARFGAADTTHSWPKDAKPWSRLHMDWAHHAAVGDILVIVDATSGWLEAAVCRNHRTETIIEHLRAIFAQFGASFCLVSDNAQEFVSTQLPSWISAAGCQLMHSPEYRPQSNRLAKRMVRNGLKSFDLAKSSVTAYIHRLLFVHRTTAVRDGRTPAEIMMGCPACCPILLHFQSILKLLYRSRQGANVLPVTFLFRQGSSTFQHCSRV